MNMKGINRWKSGSFVSFDLNAVNAETACNVSMPPVSFSFKVKVTANSIEQQHQENQEVKITGRDSL